MIVKKTKTTAIKDIPTAGFVLADEQLGLAVGGMRCEEGWKEYSTATLNSQGGSDSQTDCTK